MPTKMPQAPETCRAPRTKSFWGSEPAFPRSTGRSRVMSEDEVCFGARPRQLSISPGVSPTNRAMTKVRREAGRGGKGRYIRDCVAVGVIGSLNCFFVSSHEFVLTLRPQPRV